MLEAPTRPHVRPQADMTQVRLGSRGGPSDASARLLDPEASHKAMQRWAAIWGPGRESGAAGSRPRPTVELREDRQGQGRFDCGTVDPDAHPHSREVAAFLRSAAAGYSTSASLTSWRIPVTASSTCPTAPSTSFTAVETPIAAAPTSSRSSATSGVALTTSTCLRSAYACLASFASSIFLAPREVAHWFGR